MNRNQTKSYQVSQIICPCSADWPDTMFVENSNMNPLPPDLMSWKDFFEKGKRQRNMNLFSADMMSAVHIHSPEE